MPNTPRTPRDIGKEIDSAKPDPEVARRAARDIEQHGSETPVHDSLFGDEELRAEDPIHPGVDPRPARQPGTAVQPPAHQPIRNVGDTDHGDRQPTGGPRR